MAIGEKIQKYRKELGLSQEELGQKLLVSRQTISLWEKNQTLPTIDNLIRLSEVFGVSVDEILDLDENENNESLPFESYRFTYTETELNELYRLQRNSFYKKPVIFAIILIAGIFALMNSSDTDLMIGIVFGVLCIHLYSYIRGFLTYKKGWQNSVKHICESIYEYKMYGDYFDLKIFRNNETIRVYKCYFSEIENIQILGNWLLLQFGGQVFIIRKSDLKENSAIFSYMYVNPSKTTETSISSKFKIISDILFISSFLSVLGATAFWGYLTNLNQQVTENMWVFFVFAVIPIVSLIYGFFLKSKGYKYKKNIIAGIVMTIFLCIYGSFVFMF